MAKLFPIFHRLYTGVDCFIPWPSFHALFFFIYFLLLVLYFAVLGKLYVCMRLYLSLLSHLPLSYRRWQLLHTPACASLAFLFTHVHWRGLVLTDAIGEGRACTAPRPSGSDKS